MKEYIKTIIVCCFIVSVSILVAGLSISRAVSNHHQPMPYDDKEFQFIITDSVMTVYNNDTYVGTVKIQGELDSLLIDYLQ